MPFVNSLNKGAYVLKSSTVVLILALAIICRSAIASDYGTTGLIDIPSARMGQDAEFTSTAAIQSGINAYSITYQTFPWLEATFRYSGIAEAANTASTGYRYYDRNYEAKMRLWTESQYLPQIAIGIRDIVGTGIFGAEYIVASKKIDNFDVTLGVGWGRLAGEGMLSNPLTQISDSFNVRVRDVGVGGTASYKSWFRGENIGLFGGVKYSFDDWPVSLLAEYNPDQYDWESKRNGYRPSSPFSYGLAWEALPGITLTFSQQHGDELGLNLQAVLDTSAPPVKPKETAFISSKDILQDRLPPGIKKTRWYDTLLYDVERSGAFLISGGLNQDESQAELVIANKDYSYWPDVVERIHALADVHLPLSVSLVDYLIEDQGHIVQTIRMPRRSGYAPSRLISVERDAKLLPGKLPTVKGRKTGFVKDKVRFDVTLENRLMLFDPDNPLAYQIYAKLGTKIELPKRFQLHAGYGFDAVNNFENMRRVSNSVLPHVRSDSLKYMQEGKTGLDYLFLDKRGTLARALHYRAYGGVLETMYSGVGGELLYAPHQSRLAFALSGNWVKQRDYDKTLKHLDYATTTAFASAYWASPFYNYDVAVHVGRYLAKDVGATFEIRRTFDNGWMIGLWGTLTDVPFETFGEGSFDKGMFFRIPLGPLFGGKSSSAITTRVRPIQRDGGARIEGFTGDLWWDLRDSRYDVFANAKER
jgi:hypothetical protein